MFKRNRQRDRDNYLNTRLVLSSAQNQSSPKEQTTPKDKTKLKDKSSSALVKQDKGVLVPYTSAPLSKFDQPVILRQSPVWSRAIVWTILAVVVFGVSWAYWAKIEQVVLATGQLKPKDTTKDVQAPLNGVVREVKVKEGDLVKKGDILLVFDPESAIAELRSATNVKNSLLRENQLYRSILASPNPSQEILKTIQRLNLPQDILLLTKNRDAIFAENRFYELQLRGGKAPLTPEEQMRLEVARAELNSRLASSRLEVEQLQQQLQQNQIKINNTQTNLIANQRLLRDIQQKYQKSINQAQESLALEEKLAAQMIPLAQDGAFPQYQLEKQRQTVNDRRAELQNLKSQYPIDFQEQQQKIINNQGEIRELEKEKARIQADIAQGAQQYENARNVTAKEVTDRIAENNKRVAEIDSQLNQRILDIIVQNEKRVAEQDEKLTKAGQVLKYQEVRAQVEGKVFDIKAYQGFVANPGDRLLSLVPQDNLRAEVFITNQDIGFVRPCLPPKVPNDPPDCLKADVRIDTFPFSEFGDIEGKVIEIGSDALPPDEINKYYRFPAKIELKRQCLESPNNPVKLSPDDPRCRENSKNPVDNDIKLQSGMSVSVNIVIREDRRVIDLFVELFTKQIESLKGIR